MLNNNQYYLAMEFSSNGSLLDLVMAIHAHERKINLDLARFWFRRILMGMHFMHSRDFVHLDIKHDNILLNQANEPKLADFGFTKHVTGNISVWSCTKEYAAPEVLRGTDSYDGKKADIYSVGVVFYSALTCKYPAPIKWPAHVEDQDIKNIISLMLSPDPSKRPTVDELLAMPWF